ncbi:MAG TPA: zf-HC2 domain-containing protein [Gaiellaceae bacterium]|nr:zf-HC2 domain-containing protein [Gaiellaceae bacterium]
MAVKPIDPLCERTRAWASLELDGELSELEGVLFHEHVRSCEECAAVVEDLRQIAVIVRTTPLAEPSRSGFGFPARAAQPRARPLAVRALVAAAVIVLAAGLGLLGNSLGGSPRAPQPANPEFAFLPLSVDRQIRGLRQVPKPKQRVAPSGRLTTVV